MFLPNDAAARRARKRDEEKPAEPRATPEAGKQRADSPPKPVRIDFDKLPQRTIALPLPSRAYFYLGAGKPGMIYLVEASTGVVRGPGGAGATVSKYDLKARKLDKLADSIGAFDLSANGGKMLLRIILGPGPAARGGIG